MKKQNYSIENENYYVTVKTFLLGGEISSDPCNSNKSEGFDSLYECEDSTMFCIEAEAILDNFVWDARNGKAIGRYSANTVYEYVQKFDLPSVSTLEQWYRDMRRERDGQSMISLNNGNTYRQYKDLSINDLEYINTNWDLITSFMSDDVREEVHNEIAPCSNLDFLKRYLEVSEHDLIIG